MTLKNRKIAVENFRMFLQDYRILVEQKADIVSLSKTPNDYFHSTAQKTEELIQSYEATMLDLYNSALL